MRSRVIRTAAALLVVARVLCPPLAYAQNIHQGESFELDRTLSSQESHEYTASSHIELKKGFLSEPGRHYYSSLRIDPYGVFPPEEGLTGGPNTSDTGVVGAIGGVVDVGAMGAAIYTIPIELPEGINGMTPSLSVTYNSQAGNGLLGWGWDLTGVSAITRSGTTLYHDKSMSGVDFQNDRFCLDGQRLMVVNGYYGTHGAEYKTEIDGMAKIVSFTCDTTTGPAFFKVWTANGLLLEYGGTSDSRLGLHQNNDVCLWLLNRVEDRNGNYMTYHYNSHSTGYTLARIKYTYNETAIQHPAYEVVLDYETREDKELCFVGDNSLFQNRLLKEIRVEYNNDSVLWRYWFNYDRSTGFGTRDMYHRLTSVCFTCGNQAYNPTVIRWKQHQGECNTTTMHVNGHPFHYNSIPPQYQDLGGVKFTGDFNGDGYTDIVTTWYHGAQNWAFIYLNSCDPGGVSWHLTKTDSLRVDDNIDWIYTGDFNGDGLSDLLFLNRDRNTWISLWDFVTFDIYITSKNPNGALSFVPCTAPQNSPYWIGHNKGLSMAMGDFLGVRRDAFVFQTTESNKTTYKQYYIYYDFGSSRMKQYEIDGPSLDAEHIQAADFNGDGITELWYYGSDEYDPWGRIVKLNRNVEFEEINGDVLTRYHKVFPGDFNGDGRADFLSFASNGNGGGSWQINLSKEEEQLWPQYDITNEIGIGDPGDHGFSIQSTVQQLDQYKMVAVADFNGDGKSDIATMKRDAIVRDSLIILFAPFNADGCAYRKAFSKAGLGLASIYDFSAVIGNFLGRENASMFWKDDLVSITPISERYTVESVTDGMGNTVSFEFNYLMPKPMGHGQGDYYKMNDDLEDKANGVFAVSLPIKGVSCISEFNAGGNTVKTKYQYEGALVHNRGKGFLGFTKRSKTDVNNSTIRQRTVTWGNMAMLSPYPMMVQKCDSVFDKDGYLVTRIKYYYVPYVNNRDRLQKTFMPVLREKTVRSFDLDRHLFQKQTSVMNRFDTDISGTQNQYDNTVKLTEKWCGVTGNHHAFDQEDYEFQTVETTTYKPDDLLDWILNRPQSVLTQRKRDGGYGIISNIVTYTYETNHPERVESMLSLPNNGSLLDDPLAVKTEYFYDDFGRVVSETLKAPNNDTLLDRTTTYQFSSDYGYRFLTGKTVPMNYSGSYTYDEYYGFLQTETDCNGKMTRYSRDPLGATLWTYYPDSTVSCLATRWNGRSGYLKWSKNTGAAPCCSYYGKKGQLLQTSTVGIRGEKVLTTTQYDGFGRIKRESLPYFEEDVALWTVYDYDDYDRLIRILSPDGMREDIVYDGLTTTHVTRPVTGTGQETSTHSNIMGWTESVSEMLDGNGENTLTYSYYADGALAWVTVNGQATMRDSLRYDHRRNRIYLKDPDYGSISSVYNAFGELVCETNPQGFVTRYLYDGLGRMRTRTVTQNDSVLESTVWTYDESEGHKGLLLSVVHDNQTVSYTYDDQLRVSAETNTVGNEAHVTTYTYDDFSRLKTESYPSGVEVQYDYSTSGFLRGITDLNTGTKLWKLGNTNAAGQQTSVTLGEFAVTERTYDSLTGRLTGIHTAILNGGPTIQHLAYSYDGLGNLYGRTDHRLYNGEGIRETFAYDRLNRLCGESLDGIQVGQTQYDNYGRITGKTAGSQMVFATNNDSYNISDKPHALRSASVPDGLFPNTPQSISYTHFDKAGKIKQGNDSLCYTYGYDRQRIFMEEHVGNKVRTKRYVGNCEYVTKTQNNATDERWLTYLTGPTGVYAVVMTKNGQNQLFYVLKDNLGSWTTITDENGEVVQELSYDAWGNLRNPDTWSGSFTDAPMFDRGFTGHEHLTSFGLINMNGRMYDPVMSSFLSVDQYVQSPSNSQNFNRYAYCLNNPLRYVDPSGELFWESVLVGAIVGSFTNAAAQVMSGNVNNGAQFWYSAGVGAFSGGLGGAAGYGMEYGMNILLKGADGFWLGGVAGVTSGFAGGFVSTTSAAWMQGDSFCKGLGAGMKSGGWGALAGGLLGGLEAGYYAKQCGGNFWTGDNMVVAEHHSGSTYNGSKTKARQNAINYNNKSDFLDDVKIITNRINQEYNDWEYLVSGKIETRPTENYGMTDDLNSYVKINNKNGNGFDIVDGFVAKRRSGFFSNNVKYDVHIAPGVASYDVTSFKAVVGHELIHSLHYNLFGLNIDLAQSERVAYQYTIDVYNKAGDYFRARQNLEFAIKKGYFSIFANPLYITPF